MRPAYCPASLLSLVSLLAVPVAACAGLAPDDDATASQSQSLSSDIQPDRIAANRIAANRIAANRIAANRIAANRLSDNRLVNGQLRVNMSAAQSLLATDDGRQVFSLIVSCALPENVSLTATVNGTELEFDGSTGVAPQWLFAPLDPIGQGWVSACMFALVNGQAVAAPVSLRGPNLALSVSSSERSLFPLEEGAFFGNAFVPLDQPIQWFACRGRDAFKGQTGGLIDRTCTEPDPANPGLTQCGFFFAGDCGNFAKDRACDLFDPLGTFYLGCHNEPITAFPKRDDRVFGQVITTFVTD